MKPSIIVCPNCREVKAYDNGERITINGRIYRAKEMTICKHCKQPVIRIPEDNPEFHTWSFPRPSPRTTKRIENDLSKLCQRRVYRGSEL